MPVVRMGRGVACPRVLGVPWLRICSSDKVEEGRGEGGCLGAWV